VWCWEKEHIKNFTSLATIAGILWLEAALTGGVKRAGGRHRRRNIENRSVVEKKKSCDTHKRGRERTG